VGLELEGEPVLRQPGVPKAPPADDDLVGVLLWLPPLNEDGKPLKWRRADGIRLIFIRRLVRTGRLSDR
jgi:hypothetical protein